MEKSLIKRNKTRKTRTLRIRKKLRGNALRPRICVTKTNKHLFVQLIDDEQGLSLFGVGTQSKALKETKFNMKSKDAAEHLGQLIAKAAKDKKINHAVFDRGRFKYHGVIASLAEAARKEGLKF